MKTKLVTYCLLGALLSGLPSTRVFAHEFDGDFRIWNEFMWRQYKGERWQTYTWGELRWVDDASRLGVWFLQQKAYYKVTPGLSVGGGGAWIEIKRETSPSTTLARLEFEANPTFKLGEHTSLQWRNRLETQWWQNNDWTTEIVTRHRFRLTHKASWLPRMTRLESSNEFFFDWYDGGFNENRLRPFDIHFQFWNKTSNNIFFQLRSLKRSGSWTHAYTLGIGMRFLP